MRDGSPRGTIGEALLPPRVSCLTPTGTTITMTGKAKQAQDEQPETPHTENAPQADGIVSPDNKTPEEQREDAEERAERRDERLAENADQ